MKNDGTTNATLQFPSFSLRSYTRYAFHGSMQRSLTQVVEKDERERLVKSLLDYIHSREDVSRDGCPLLLIYPFLYGRNLPSSWLIGTLKKLRMDGSVYEVREHYRILGLYEYPEEKKNENIKSSVPRPLPTRK